MTIMTMIHLYKMNGRRPYRSFSVDEVNLPDIWSCVTPKKDEYELIEVDELKSRWFRVTGEGEVWELVRPAGGTVTTPLLP